jgi:hypothetical protein
MGFVEGTLQQIYALAAAGADIVRCTCNEIEAAEGLAQIVVPGIPSHEESMQDFTIPAMHRGVVKVGPVRTVRADPLGLVRRERIWTAESELFIHPRTIGKTGFEERLVPDRAFDLTELRLRGVCDAPRAGHLVPLLLLRLRERLGVEQHEGADHDKKAPTVKKEQKAWGIAGDTFHALGAMAR